jgi:aspartate aminotransferase
MKPSVVSFDSGNRSPRGNKEIVFSDGHVSATRFAAFRDRVLIVGGFSKTYAMSLGYVAETRPLFERIAQFQQHTVTCAASFVQRAAFAALESVEVARDVAQMREAYRPRRDLVQQVLGAVSALSAAPMEGTFYAWVRLPFGVVSQDFARGLWEECAVGVVPGGAFGASGEGWMRLGYGRQDLLELLEGLTRIRRYVD